MDGRDRGRTDRRFGGDLVRPSSAAAEHVHRLAATDHADNYPTRDALLTAQRARCPVCAGHDHTDHRPFGFDHDSQPIPAWWFTCPGTNCGNADEAQAFIARWTPDGLAWMRDRTGQAA